MKIWLDDCREPPPGWLWAMDYASCISALKTYHVVAISLDHDLGPQAYEAVQSDYTGNSDPYFTVREKTGYDVALYMIEHASWPSNIYIHSASPPGRERMYKVMRKAMDDTYDETSRLILSTPGEHPSGT